MMDLLYVTGVFCIVLNLYAKQVSGYCSEPNVASIEGEVETKLVLYGSNIELTCCIKSNQRKSLTWFNPKNAVIPNYFTTPNIDRHYMIPDLLRSNKEKEVIHLAILSFEEKDEGTYTCRDTSNAKSKPARIRLKGQPRIFITSEKEQFLEEGKPGEIRCHVEGHPKVNITWFYQGRYIQPISDDRSLDGRFQFKRAHQTLVVSRVSRDYAGHYLCKAEVSSYSSGQSEFIEMQPILVEVFTTPNIESGPRLLNKNSATEGGSMKILCIAAGQPTVDIVWLKNGNRTIYADDSKVFIQQLYRRGTAESVLEMNDLQPRDAGNYTCRAITKIPQINVTRTSERSIVPSLVFLPQIGTDTRLNATANVGQMVSLRCQIFGAKLRDLRIEVLHNNRTCDNTARRKVIKKTDKEDKLIAEVLVEIFDVQPEDGGNYICIGATSVGSVSYAGLVRVLYAPRVTAINSKVFGLPYFRNILSCEAKALPTPQWTWVHNNRAVRSDSSNYYIDTKSQGDTSRSDLLILPTFWNTDIFGSYECTAKNSLGENYTTIQFWQGYRPKPPKVKPCGKAQRSIQLCITTPEDTGGLPLSHYQVRYKLLNSKANFLTLAYPITRRIELPNLQSGSKFLLAVSVVNAAGRSSNTYVNASTLRLSAPVIKVEETNDHSNIGSDAYTVYWTIEDTGGMPIDNYFIDIRPIQYSSDGEINAKGRWRSYFGAVTNRNYFQMNTLQPNTVYQMRLSLGSGLGRSENKEIIFRTKTQNGIMLSLVHGNSAISAAPRGMLWYSICVVAWLVTHKLFW